MYTSAWQRVSYVNILLLVIWFAHQVLITSKGGSIDSKLACSLRYSISNSAWGQLEWTNFLKHAPYWCFCHFFVPSYPPPPAPWGFSIWRTAILNDCLPNLYYENELWKRHHFLALCCESSAVKAFMKLNIEIALNILVFWSTNFVILTNRKWPQLTLCLNIVLLL